MTPPVQIPCRPRAAIELPAEPPEWLHLVPVGSWVHWSGRELTIGAAETAEIVASFVRARIDLVVDYEHQTLNTLSNGQPAPAAGWIDRMEARADGVWGHVQSWTSAAIGFLSRREYRYLSPVIELDARDRVSGESLGMALSSVALTNNPFFAGDLSPVVSRGGPLNLLPLLLAALALPEDTTAEAALEAVKALKEKADSAATLEARAAVGDGFVAAAGWKKVPKDAAAQIGALVAAKGRADELETQLAAAKAVQVDLQAQLLTAKAAAASSAVDNLVARAVDSGKVPPALEKTFREFAIANVATATKWLDEAPVLVASGRQVDPAVGAKKTADTLSPEEQAICAQLRLTPEKYLAAKGGK